MGIRDLIAYAADQYGTDRGLLDSVAKLESTYNPRVENTWDSNAKAGVPSYGLFQFIQPTFNAFARQAAQANPQAWQRYNGNFNYRDPRQQALAASWAFANGKGSHWTTYGRAQQAAASYDYKPRWNGTGSGVAPGMQKAYTPQQLAQVRAGFDQQVDLAKQQQTEAVQRRARFDTLDNPVLDRPTFKSSDLRGMSYKDRAAVITAPTQARSEWESGKQQAQLDADTARLNVTQAQQKRDQVLDDLAKQQLPSANSELGGAGNSAIRAQLVATARDEVGTLAQKAMKYIRAAGGTGYEPWCGDFVQYVFKQNGLKPPPARSVPRLLEWAKENDTFRSSGRAGDLVMFDWNGDGTPDHVGLVAGGAGAGRYQTIEGNTSGFGTGSAVANKTRASNILGFVDALSLLGRQ